MLRHLHEAVPKHQQAEASSETADEALPQFETLLASLSTTFINMSASEADRKIVAGLQHVAEAFALDHVALAEFPEDLLAPRLRYWWGVPGAALAAYPSLHNTFPWYARQLKQGDLVCFTRLDELPAEATAEKRYWRRCGVKSCLALPLTAGGAGIYVMSFETFHATYAWPRTLIIRLGLIGKLFVQALRRKYDQEKLEEVLRFEALVAHLSAVFARVSVSDIDKEIENGLRAVVERLNIDQSTLLEFSPDQRELYSLHSYIRPGMKAYSPGTMFLQEMPWIVSQLLRGEIVRFRQWEDLPEEAHIEKQFGRHARLKSQLSIPVSMSDSRLYVIYLGAFRTEIDWPVEWIPRLRLIGEIFANALARKQAEEASRRLGHELAHAARVTMLGELSASLAHELNQPLAAILSNAQAARRFLARESPALAEVREALTDIIADDQRAGKIIQQLRALGKKTPQECAPLDVNALVQQVVSLVRSDALERRVTISLALDIGPPYVSGDRIQLQQVLLNLALNAFEAMQQTTDWPRELLICTARQDDMTLLVSFRDTGVGVDETTLQQIFTAFFTTRAEGMGLGLAISRSIIEAHGGRIWALPNAHQGTTVCFTLPLEEETTA
jgi:signal transduction histidine kinase